MTGPAARGATAAHADRHLRYAATAATGLLLLTVVAGLLVPIYTDEVGWRFQLSRFVQDGGVDRFIGENCGPNTLARPPVFMWPVRWFSATMTRWFPDPALVRLAGVAAALAALGLLRALVGRVAPDPARRALLLMLACALLGYGVLPLLLVLSRPEQPILLALLVGMLVTLAPPRRLGTAARLALVVAAALVAMSYHLKALFYLPVFALMVWHVTRGAPWWWRVVALAILAGAAASAFGYWSARFACPADAVLRAKLERENAAVLLLQGGWTGVVARLPDLWRAASPYLYIFIATPAPHAMSDWLPPDAVPAPLIRPWLLLGRIIWYGSLALLVLEAWRGRRTMGRHPGFPAVCVLLGCATVWAALQFNKNAYESALYLPVLALAILLGLAAAPSLSRATRMLVPAFCLLSAAGQVVLLGSYVPRLWPVTAAGGYLADQPYSIRAYHYAQVRRTVLAAGRRCGIGPDAPGLLVDDLTYFAYADTYRPYHRLGVLSDWQGSIRDPAAWLASRHSSGAVIACAYLPPAMRRRAIATGPVCCVRP